MRRRVFQGAWSHEVPRRAATLPVEVLSAFCGLDFSVHSEPEKQRWFQLSLGSSSSVVALPWTRSGARHRSPNAWPGFSKHGVSGSGTVRDRSSGARAPGIQSVARPSGRHRFSRFFGNGTIGTWFLRPAPYYFCIVGRRWKLNFFSIFRSRRFFA